MKTAIMIKVLILAAFVNSGYAVTYGGCDYAISQEGIPASLTNPNSVYCLTENVSLDVGDVISIEANNITLNCNQHSITYCSNVSGLIGDEVYAIKVSYHDSSTIENCVIVQDNENLSFPTSAGCYGITVSTSSYSVIRNNVLHFKSNESDGITIDYNCYNTVVENNTINASGGGDTTGIATYRTTGTNISGNNVAFYERGGVPIYLQNDKNLSVMNNFLLTESKSRDYMDGIFGTVLEHIIIYNNKITVDGTGADADYGVSLRYSNYSLIRNNTINSTKKAIHLYSTVSNITIYENNITAPVWVDNNGTDNNFNTSSNGNIYYFSNGNLSSSVCNISSSTNTYADNGSDLPFKSSTACITGHWSGNGEDWHPWVGPLTTITTASSTTTSSTTPVCPLKGDMPPCGTVSISEVVNLVNLWSNDMATLSQVIALINAWAQSM